MTSIIKSKDFKEMIYLILRKPYTEPLFQKDLEKVRSITLQSSKLSDEKTDIILSEIALCENIEDLLICGFEIDEDFLDVINELSKLKVLQFSECTFFSQKKLRTFMNMLVLDRCENLGIAVGNSRKIRIIGQNRSLIDLNDLGELNNVEELYLNSLDIFNISKVRELSGLRMLDLSGSSIDDADSIAQLPIKTKLSTKYLIS